MEPKYQELLKEDIPHVSTDGVHVAVIAGESYGASVSPMKNLLYVYGFANNWLNIPLSVLLNLLPRDESTYKLHINMSVLLSLSSLTVPSADSYSNYLP